MKVLECRELLRERVAELQARCGDASDEPSIRPLALPIYSDSCRNPSRNCVVAWYA